MSNQSLISEFWEFLKVRKRYWLLPIVIMLSLLGMLIVFTEGSAVAPFIYALFWLIPPNSSWQKIWKLLNLYLMPLCLFLLLWLLPETTGGNRSPGQNIWQDNRIGLILIQLIKKRIIIWKSNWDYYWMCLSCSPCWIGSLREIQQDWRDLLGKRCQPVWQSNISL